MKDMDWDEFWRLVFLFVCFATFVSLAVLLGAAVVGTAIRVFVYAIGTS